MGYPESMAPSPLQRLAEEDLRALLARLKDETHPLASALAALTERHFAELEAHPAQWILQMRGRIARDDTTRDWLDDAAIVERSKGLVLHSRTLEGIEKVERWRRPIHRKLVHKLTPLPDGKSVVSAGEDGALYVWSVGDLQAPPRALDAHKGPVNHLAVSLDGKWLATAGDDGTVRLWKTDKLARPKKLEGHTNYVRQVAFARDALVSVSEDGTARVWSLEDGRCLHTLEHGQEVMSLAVTEDRSLLATATLNSAMHLWDARTGQKLGLLYGNEEKVLSLMRGLYLSGTNRSEVGHKSYPRALAFSKDQKHLWSVATEWIVWDIEARRELIRQPAMTKFSANDVCWLDEQRVAIAADHVQVVRIRDERGWLPAGAQEALGAYGVGLAQVTALCLSHDGRTLLSGDREGQVTAWDLTVDPSSQPTVVHTGVVTNIEPSPSRAFAVSCSIGDAICVWDLRDGSLRTQRTLEGMYSSGQWYAFARDESQVAFGKGKGVIELVSLVDGRPASSILIQDPKNYQSVSAVLFAPDGRALYAGLGSGGLFRVTLDGATEKAKGYADTPTRLAWVDPDTLIAADRFAPSEDPSDYRGAVDQLTRWDPVTLERRERLSADPSELGQLDCSFGPWVHVPQGLLTLSGTREPGVFLRDPKRLESARRVYASGTYLTAVTVLDDGSVFMIVHDDARRSLVVLDRALRTVLFEAEDPEGWSTEAVTPDGALALRLQEHTLELYELRTSAVVARWFADAPLRCACFGADSRRWLVGDARGRVHILEYAR